jgi:predicted nucleic acid-binding Zn ribbon protein
MATELKTEIKMSSQAHLSTINHRQKRRPEDRDAVDDAWDQTFGRPCPECGAKHARHSRCREGGDA